MIELTEKHLGLPAAFSRKYGKGRQQVMDEIESVGALALVEAAHDYDPTKGASINTYLYNRVKWAAIGVIDPRRRGNEASEGGRVSLNALRSDGEEGTLLDALGEECDPGARVETLDQYEAALKRLWPLDAAALRLVHEEGLTLREAGERMGCSAEYVRQRVERATKKLRECSLTYTSPGKPTPPRWRGNKWVPVGTISIVKRRGWPCRMIKVRDDGPRSGRWVAYARWLWERANGPVPPGMAVGHKDGLELNDDPENLILRTRAESLCLWHRRDDAETRKQKANSARGVKRHCRERAQARRALGVIQPTLWYLADHDRREVSGPWGRKKQLALDASPKLTPVRGCDAEKLRQSGYVLLAPHQFQKRKGGGRPA